MLHLGRVARVAVCASVVFFCSGAAPAPLVSHPVSTSRAMTQRAFDLGLTYFYAYNRTEAARAFRSAQRDDPDLAAAYWGQALAESPNYNEDSSAAQIRDAEAALRAAQRVSAHAGPEERALIAALARRYRDGDPNTPNATRRYTDAMLDVARRFPQDPDAAVIAAEALLEVAPSVRRADDSTQILALLHGALRRVPGHIGANHLIIHALEDGPHPEAALTNANFLRSLSLDPAESHLRHMPAHIDIRLGHWEAALRATRAAALDDERYANTGGDGDPAHLPYYGHNVSFWLGAALMQGDYREAARPAAILRRYGHADALFLAYRERRWNELLQPAAARGPRPALAFRYYRGLALIVAGRTAEARRELDRLAGAADGSALVVQAAILQAKLWIARGGPDAARGIAQLDALARRQDRGGFESLPVWFYPLREWIGEADLRRAQPAAAEHAFRDDLRRYPSDPYDLYGLFLSLVAQHRPAEAERVRAAFTRAWRAATGPPRLGDSL